MSSENKIVCPGCGAPFHKDTPNTPGYLPSNKEPASDMLCQRCFQMKHYGVFRKANITDPFITKSIEKIARKASAIILVIDVTRIEHSLPDLDWVENLRKPVLVVANKFDLVEKWITKKDLLQWVAAQTAVSPEQIVVMSSLSRKDVMGLRERIEDNFSVGDSILFVGSANVGKSTLLSSLLRSKIPTVSRLPGTTVGIVQHVTRDGIVYYDAPGLSGDDPWLSKLCPDCLASLSPKKKIETDVQIYKAGQAIMFGGLASAEIISAGERGWVRLATFAPDSVVVHKTQAHRIEKIFEHHVGELIAPPCKECLKVLAGKEDYRETQFNLYPGRDLALPGLGWISVYSGNCTVLVRAPKIIEPVERPWLIPSQPQRHHNKKR